MGGWWRLWIVASAIMFGLAMVTILSSPDLLRTERFVGRDAERNARAWLKSTQASSRLIRSAEVHDVSLNPSDEYAGIGTRVEDISDLVTPEALLTVRVPPPPKGYKFEVNDATTFVSDISCFTWVQLPRAVALALVVPGLLLLCGRSLTWIADGFRSTKSV